MSIKQLFDMREFRGLAAVTLAGLALLCGALVALNILQGPRVRSAAIDVKTAAVLANQRLQLHTNQPVGRVTEKQVTITPSTPFRITAAGNTIVMQFTQPLRYDTKYQVRIANGDKHFGYSFRTGQADLFYAVNEGNKGTIYRRQMNDAKATAVFTGDKIGDFLIAGTTLVINTQQPSGNSTLLVKNVQEPDAPPTTIRLPRPGFVLGLRASADRQSFGFRFTATNANGSIVGQLGLYNFMERKLTWLNGANGQPVSALDWQYGRDGKTLLVQTFDSSVFAVNAKGAWLPLGQFVEIGGFSHDGSSALVFDAKKGESSLDLTTIAVNSLPLPERDAMIAEALPLRTQAGYLLQTDIMADEEAAQRIYIRRDKAAKALFSITGNQGYVRGIALSPNDQFAVVEKNKEDAGVFAYDIIDTFTGRKVESLDAAMVRWQQ